MVIGIARKQISGGQTIQPSRLVRGNMIGARTLLSAAAISMAGLTAPAWAQAITGKVIGIADGDTLSVLDHHNKQRKIRLQGIDAPEKRQAWGRRSMQNLAALAFHKEVMAECGKVDKYGREVCKILVEDRDVNLAQIESGMAWWYRAYDRSRSRTTEPRMKRQRRQHEMPGEVYGRMRTRNHRGRGAARNALSFQKASRIRPPVTLAQKHADDSTCLRPFQSPHRNSIACEQPRG